MQKGIIWTDMAVEQFDSKERLELLLTTNTGYDLTSYSNPEAEGSGVEYTQDQIPDWCFGHDCNHVTVFSSGAIITPNTDKSCIDLYDDNIRGIIGNWMRIDMGWNWNDYKNTEPKYSMPSSNLMKIIDTFQTKKVIVVMPGYLASEKPLTPNVECHLVKGFKGTPKVTVSEGV